MQQHMTAAVAGGCSAMCLGAAGWRGGAQPPELCAARPGGRASVRVYNLAKQALAKKLALGAGLSCLAVHPSGDHVITGTEV